jgi:uncharacterized membrane protein HdeD (DUF308 family)
VAITSFFEARKWWVFVLRGVAAIAFGVLAWIYPGKALLTLIWLFGIYAIVDGVSSLAPLAGPRSEAVTASEQPRWARVLSGLVSIGAGVIAFLNPRLTAVALVLLIAIRAIVIGVLQIVAAIRLRKEVRGEWMLALSGVVSLVFGVLVGLFPGAGAIGLLLWIGAYAILFGGLLVVVGLRLRSIDHRGLGGGGISPFGERFAGSH